EEAPGPEDEDGTHHGVHDDHGRLRQIEAAPRLGGAHDETARDRAAHAAEAADHHDDEGVDDDADAHPEIGGGHGRRGHAAEPGQRARGAEHQSTNARDVGAKAVGHLAVLGHGADDEP